MQDNTKVGQRVVAKLGGQTYSGIVQRAENNAMRSYVEEPDKEGKWMDGPDNWYVEFTHDVHSAGTPGQPGYLKQIPDGVDSVHFEEAKFQPKPQLSVMLAITLEGEAKEAYDRWFEEENPAKATTKGEETRSGIEADFIQFLDLVVGIRPEQAREGLKVRLVSAVESTKR